MSIDFDSNPETKFAVLGFNDFRHEAEAAKQAGFDVVECVADLPYCQNRVLLYRFAGDLLQNKSYLKDVKLLGDLRTANNFQLVQTREDCAATQDLTIWYHVLAPYTPKTYTAREMTVDRFYELSKDEEVSFFLRGTKSSVKNLNSESFVYDFEDYLKVRFVFDNLEPEIGPLVFREEENLKTVGWRVDDTSIPLEFRYFVLNKKIVCSGFYWVPLGEEVLTPEGKARLADPNTKKTLDDFVTKLLEVPDADWPFGAWPKFLTLDVALKSDGAPILIECNEGQNSGLNGIDPLEFYTNFARVWRETETGGAK